MLPIEPMRKIVVDPPQIKSIFTPEEMTKILTDAKRKVLRDLAINGSEEEIDKLFELIHSHHKQG